MAPRPSGRHEELPARAGDARAYRQRVRPGFADCAPSGRVRLDALARWLQDIAYADVEDAGLEREAVWVVRRTRMRVNRFPRFGEHFELTTFCSGLGRMWAERRTDVVREPGGAGPDAPDVEAVSLWVHLDGEHWRPTPLTEAEVRTYSGSEPHRRVSARLRHPSSPPPPSSPPSGGGLEWRFRAIDCDIADHVNNAAYWQPLEEELLGGSEPVTLDAEIEYRAPAQPGLKRVVVAGEHRWIVGEDDELHASMRVGPAIGG